MSQASQAKTRKSPPAPAPVPRKRRKRTVVTGAADDCFTCARRGSSCDRRRPYCSQCLENGQDCSGYRTTLTWGVGVASRGKFRGLSVPVSGAQPAATHAKPGCTASAEELSQQTGLYLASTAQSSTIRTPQRGHYPPAAETNDRPTQTHIPSPPILSPEAVTPNNLINLDPTLPYSERADLLTNAPPVPVRANTLTGEPCALLVQPPTTTIGWPNFRYSQDVQWTEQKELEEQKTRCSGSHPLTSAYQSPSLSQLLLARSVGRTPRLRYLISYFAEVIAPVIVAFDSPTNPFRTSVLRLAQESTSLQEAIATLSTSNLRQRQERGIISTGRTAPARMSSLAHRALTDKAFKEWYDTSAPEGFAREEQYHRSMAVRVLNMELADPHQRLSDSVLATLLILCLFHVCDTGVAQFKTQFAGVTKLLAIRMRNSSHLSDELKWFIRMFTWYDTMTATTNDREIQLHRTCVDVTAVSEGEWSLENLAGCDAGLFKLISHLGRLNILSQNREAKTPASPDMFIPTTAPPPSMIYRASDSVAPGISSAADPYVFPLPTPPEPGERTEQPISPAFWMEWFSIRQQLQSWRLPRQRPQSSFHFEAGHASSPSMTAYISPPSSPLSQCGVAPQNVEDVFHISESFRHSGILYTERLAYPNLPSGDPRIQHIVQCSIAHIMAVKSDVYLLWPLFITGSECVFEEHRLIIQERCKDISKDSGFFNNLSCLELLEKIWAENPASAQVPGDRSSWMAPVRACGSYIGATRDGVPVSPRSWSAHDESIVPLAPAPHTVTGPGFRWHQVMQAKRSEGEYMVV